jgi:hypothetical protein
MKDIHRLIDEAAGRTAGASSELHVQNRAI